MEVTVLGIIFILLLVIPNIIFRKFYFLGKISSDHFDKHQFLFFIYSIIPGFLLHSTFILLIYRFFDRSINYIALTQLVSNIASNNNFFQNKELYIYALYLVLFYNILLWIYSATIGMILFWVVRNFKLDLKIGFFRFENKWHYLFTGEYLDFPGVPGNYKDIKFVWLDLLTSASSDPILYSGILLDYSLKKNSNELGSVTLHRPIRQFLFNRNDKNYNIKKGVKKSSIPGYQLVIPSDRIQNINISYYSDWSVKGSNDSGDGPDIGFDEPTGSDTLKQAFTKIMFYRVEDMR